MVEQKTMTLKSCKGSFPFCSLKGKKQIVFPPFLMHKSNENEVGSSCNPQNSLSTAEKQINVLLSCACFCFWAWRVRGTQFSFQVCKVSLSIH